MNAMQEFARREMEANRSFWRTGKRKAVAVPRKKRTRPPKYVLNMESPEGRILEEYAAANDMTVARLIGPGRKKSIVPIRQECFLRLREHGLTNFAIGTIFSRNHSTISHGCVAAAERRAQA